MTFLKFVETTKFRSQFCGRITHSERFHNTRPGHLSEHVKDQGINIKVLFTLALVNSCKQLKNRGSDGRWKIEKCFVKKDTDRCIRRTLSTAEKKNIVSWSYKTPKSTIQSHFCNFLATIFRVIWMYSLSLFHTEKREDPGDEHCARSFCACAFPQSEDWGEFVQSWRLLSGETEV